MVGFSHESIADRVSALIWLGNNIGEQWPYYIDNSSMVFNGWQFIRDDYSGEIVFSNMKVPTISRHEFVEVFRMSFLQKIILWNSLYDRIPQK
ncbi:hypothetical protein ACV1D8_22540 [Aeromonas caviae]|uniref:Uncharacterized protein n=1 Tax=Aeromonas caviae TaxID=648 RepID=A0AAV4YQV3_AERCA|nr:hypothetical protein [Aeromonas caviae]BCM76869.1 hypothetical protein KAM329_034170 [Aeromonas caviae]GJA34476.1 hypothetical protein KAM341_41540 [Aeromonas caviae]GJA38927.1 hypothetical protein KAM342_41700 [Aeromonas caviae]GJA43477.1 hypothetical protein KAM343_42730 [Aeromonas caviae]GJA52408.1 hypothetical protein KAM347_41990 [Aeromonas caviae]